MNVQQFVMAYQIEQDRIRALLPDGFISLRPVLRINAEIREAETAYIEYNTPVKAFGKRGWLNIGHWETGKDPLTFVRKENMVEFHLPFLTLSFSPVGIEGGCPAEKDNEGCFFLKDSEVSLRPAESIDRKKEFCDCRFSWKFHDGDAKGVSQGKTLPAFEEVVKNQYPKEPLTAEHAAAISCEQVLGSYMVIFERKETMKGSGSCE